MNRVVAVQGSVDDTGQAYMKLQVGPTTTFGQVKAMVAARTDGARLFFPSCPLGDGDVFVGDRLEFTHVDPALHARFDQHYQREVAQWSSVPSELLANMKLK